MILTSDFRYNSYLYISSPLGFTTRINPSNLCISASGSMRPKYSRFINVLNEKKLVFGLLCIVKTPLLFTPLGRCAWSLCSVSIRASVNCHSANPAIMGWRIRASVWTWSKRDCTSSDHLAPSEGPCTPYKPPAPDSEHRRGLWGKLSTCEI